MKTVVFDTETTGMPDQTGDLSKQPHIIQFASITYDLNPRLNQMKKLSESDILIKPPILIPSQISRITGILDETVMDMPNFESVADEIEDIFSGAEILVAHNFEFDYQMLRNEFSRLGRDFRIVGKCFDTMKETKELCKLEGRSGNYKLPRLMELYQFLFGETFENAHNAMRDVEATAKCFEKLIREGYFSPQELTAVKTQIKEETSQISLF